MSLNSMGLGFVFTARDLATGTISRLDRQFRSLDDQVTGGASRMSAAFREVTIGLGVMAAGASLAMGALRLAEAAGAFEQQMAAIGAITQATTADLELLRRAAINAGIATQFSPLEAAQGLASLTSAGQTAAQAAQTLVPALDLAAGAMGQLTVEQASNAIVGTLNAYSLAADEAADVTDRLLRVTQLSNFQARDFEAGLSKAAATGAIFNQSMDDVLLSLGLLRNRNIDASSAGTALSEAVRRVGGETRALTALTEAGVEVFDAQSGQMRSIVDIMLDFGDATRDMSEAERSRSIGLAFGARGMLAYNAIMNASFTTMRDGVQVTLEGRDALAALRQELDASSGTADDFRRRLADTFAGQRTLLRGSLETIGVLLGEPLVQAMRPLVTGLVDAVAQVVAALEGIPMPLKRLVASLVLGASVFLIFVGGAIALKGALVLLKVGMAAFGLTLGSVLASLLPVAGAMALAGLAVASMVFLYRRNLGGLADFIDGLVGRVRLFFRALSQLFSDGGFSGSVMEELGRAENQGVRSFVIRTWQLLHRLRRAWEGFTDGVRGGLQALAPVFVRLREALGRVVSEVSGLVGGLGRGASMLPSNRFAHFGALVGEVLVGVFGVLVRAVTAVVRFAAGFIAGFRAVWSAVAPVGEGLREAFAELGRALSVLLQNTGHFGDAGMTLEGVMHALGYVLGGVLGAALGVVIDLFAMLVRVTTLTVQALGVLREAFIVAGTWIGESAAQLYLWFTETLPGGIRRAVAWISSIFGSLSALLDGAVERMLGLFQRLAEGIRAFLLPVGDFFGALASQLHAALQGVLDFVLNLARRIPSRLLPADLREFVSSPPAFGAPAPGRASPTPPTGFEAPLRAGTAAPAVTEAAERSSAMRQLRTSVERATSESGSRDRPMEIRLEVDGETLARVGHEATRRAAERSFAPIPSY